MSDVFGAEDNTASGGLQTDMPEIGAAPPAPRYAPPSALGSLVQSMFGGHPAPRSAQLGPSPYAMPGRSQIPPQPQQGPRWTGTTASLALPRGSPQPPANFTPYQRSIPIRDPSQWGSPPMFANLPASFEIPSVLQSVSQFFGQNGSQLSIPLALSMGKNAGAFIDGMMKGEEFRAKMAKERMTEAADKLAWQEQQNHIEYGELAGQYEAVDPMMSKPINGVGVREAWAQKAYQLGDQKMISLVENGANIGEMIKFQQLRDANLQDLQKANQKTAEQDDEDASAAFGVPKPTRTSSAPLAWQPSQQGTPSQGGGATPAPEGGPAPKPAAAAGGGGQQPIAPDSPERSPGANIEQGPDFKKLLPYQQIGLNSARGASEMQGLPKGVQKAARQYQTEVEQQMDNVVAHSEGKSPEQIASELRRISPAIAEEFNGLTSGDVALPGGMAATAAHPYWRDLADLAQKAKPGWTQYDAQNKRDMMHEYVAGPTGRRMSRVESMSSALKGLLGALNEIRPGEKPPEGALEAWLNKRFTGDPRWGRVFAATNTYVQESQAIASQTGNFHEGDVQRVMREMPWTAGPDFTRGWVSKEAEIAVGTINDLNDDFKTNIGRDSMHYNKKAVADLAAAASYDPKTKRFTGPVPPDMVGLDGYTPDPAAPSPSGLPPGWTVTPVP